MATSLHQRRLDTVLQRLLENGAESVLDLGCGRGLLIDLLLQEQQFKRVVGVDACARELSAAEARLSGELEQKEGRLELVHGSFLDLSASWNDFDAAVMVEALEHIDPRELSKVEKILFGVSRPQLVILTTPNREYNAIFGQPEGKLRHRDHRFEWSRAKFISWARGIGLRNSYAVEFEGIGQYDSCFGCPTQLARFTLTSSDVQAGQ